MASLRAFFNYLEFEEILDTNPMRKIKTRFQEPKQLPKTIPLRLIEQLLAAAIKEHERATTPFGLASVLRDRAMLETLFATGMRVSELCSLKKDDINLDDGTIKIMGKGTKERIIQIENSDVIKSLRQYQSANTNNSAFFLQTGWAHAIQNNLFVS
jgi:integrase/recombinase XerD